jgi:hypothetical protein
MNTKIAVLCLVFILLCGLVFSQVHLQGGMNLMYLTNKDAARAIFPCRLGATGDILFSLSRTVELGAELGLYAMLIPLVFVNFGLIDIPIDALFHINITPDRKLALELHGGLWISEYQAQLIDGETDTFSDRGFHLGGRLVLWHFYIGADYIAQFDSAAIEVGFKLY